MIVRFWGTRGSVPTPGRATEKYGGNTTCVELSHEGQRIILDAGTGIRELGIEMTREGPSSSLMLLSHLHWDHIQGLPFFQPLFLKGFQLTILAPSDLKESVEKVLNKQMAKDVFPVDFADVAADIQFEPLEPDGTTKGPFRITAVPLTHPGGCSGYRVEAGGRTVFYATDNEIDPEGNKAAFDSYVEAIKGADLLIADGQYILVEYPKRRGWGHGVQEYLFMAARAAGIKRMAITHHDPMRDDVALADLERYTRKTHRELEIFFARDLLAVRA